MLEVLVKGPSVSLVDSRDKREFTESENLGLASIASFLRGKNISVDLCSFDTCKSVEEQIDKLESNYDIYGFSLFHENVEFVFSAAKRIKEKNPKAIVCAGSKFATEAADFILNECHDLDFIVLGDGEFPLLEVAQAYPDLHTITNLTNIRTRESIKVNHKDVSRVAFENGHWPTAHDFARNTYGRPSAIARLYSKRGCTCYCSFCLLPSKAQKKLKKFSGRPMHDLFHEVLKLNREFGFKAFMIHDCPFDDAGEMGIQRVEEFCDLLLSHDQPFSFECMIDGKFIDENSVPLIQKMRKAGFSQIMYLIGSGNEHDEYILKKQRNIRLKESAIDLFEANDVEVMLEFFSYTPFSTLQSFENNYHFLTRRKAYVLDYFIYKAPVYYGSDLYLMCREKKLLKPDYTYKDVFEYAFEEPYFFEVDNFFQNVIRKSQIIHEDFSFHNFVYLCNWLRALFPEGMKDIMTEVNSIKSKLHTTLLSYFNDVMVKKDLTSSRENFTDFESTLLNIYKESKLLQMKQLRQPDIRKYLMRN